MKLQLIYLDTSVFGGCFEPEFSEWSIGLIRDIENGLFQATTSEIVAFEIDAGAPEIVQQKFSSFLNGCSPEVLSMSEEVLTLSDAYLAHGILTQKFRNDMMHIALATVHGVDIVASWNFKHIVRYEKIVKFNAVNLELGYHQIAIHSPRELATYGKD
jgi:predicted nucleic acid-binding protein